VQPQPKEDTVSELTRLGFVKSSAAAAAGMTVIGALVAQEASADTTPGEEPVVAYVSDPRKGEISVMRGDREVVIRDKKLAAQIYGSTR
jgi:hypothetical protein